MKKESAFDRARVILELKKTGNASNILYIDYPFSATVNDVSSDDDIRVDIEDQITGAIYQYCSSDTRKCIQNATPKALIRRVARSITRL